MARIWYPPSVQVWRGKWQSSCGFFQVLFLKPLKLSGSFFVVRLDKVCSIRLLQVDPPWNYILLIGSLNHLSGWFFSWLHHLSFTELANKLACCSIVRADALLSTCKTHSSTAYVRKLEAKVLVSAGPVGCFPPKLLSDHRKLVYSGLLLVSNWLHLFATMYRVARNTTGPVCYQKNSKGLSLASSPQLCLLCCVPSIRLLAFGTFWLLAAIVTWVLVPFLWETVQPPDVNCFHSGECSMCISEELW